MLEQNAASNAEALVGIHRLAERYRERAVIAEAESGGLRSSQLDTLCQLEKERRLVAACNSKLKEYVHANPSSIAPDRTWG